MKTINEIRAMSADERKIATAESCGWKNIHVFNRWKEGGPMRDGSIIGDFKGITRRHLPDYLHDLNACHEAEGILKQNRHSFQLFCHYLLMVCNPSQDRLAKDWTWEEIENGMAATAEQRNAAFLAVMLPALAKAEGRAE